MCQSSRAIIFRFNNKNQWQMFLLLYVRHVCVPQKDTNMVSPYKALQITREWKTAETWFLARLFIYQSSIVSQILDFIQWMGTILVLITWQMKTRELALPKSLSTYPRLRSSKLTLITSWFLRGISNRQSFGKYCFAKMKFQWKFNWHFLCKLKKYSSMFPPTVLLLDK